MLITDFALRHIIVVINSFRGSIEITDFGVLIQDR
jgi:hypothetical protein